MVSKPPYAITEKAADYLTKIAESVIRLEFGTGFKRNIRLHRENCIKTIYSLLAIEGNALSADEVASVIDGKLVADRQADIKEVKNAYQTYDRIMTFDLSSINDSPKAHKLITDGLIRESGMFCSGDVGVLMAIRSSIWVARSGFVPELVDELFTWVKESKLHPLLKSGILHYEIEAIHPFADSNGRLGRL